MLYRDIIAVCSEIHTQHINTLCGLNAEFFNFKSDNTYSDYWAFKSYKHSIVFPPLNTGPSISISISISSNSGGRARNGRREEQYVYFRMTLLILDSFCII